MNIFKLNDISQLTERSVVTVGMFDGVHIGHRHILSTLMEVSERLSLRPVVVTFDLHPRQVLSHDAVKAFRITTNAERYALLEQFGVTDVVEVHFDAEMAQMSACDFLRRVLVGRLHAEALVLGFDNMFGNKMHNDFDRLPAVAESLGVRIFEDTAVRFRDMEVSSTQIRKALYRGDVALASAMLGTGYKVTGRVAQGRQVGRRIGFPTANVEVEDDGKALPAEGVYAVRVEWGGTTLRGMANLGGQPTFGNGPATFEVNIFDFDGNLYGQTVTVEFVERLRDIRKFESPQALADQLEADRSRARKLLLMVLLFIGVCVGVCAQPDKVYKSLAEVRNPEEVYILQLRNKRLKQLPAEVLSMPNLRELDLRGNRIARLPDSIGSLTHLRRIDLSRNPLMALPASWSALEELEELVLWATYVTSVPETYARLDGVLQLLDLRGCPLTLDDQDAIEKILPNVKKIWDLACNCGD